MDLKRITTPAVLTLAFTIAAIPALAQSSSRDERRRAQSQTASRSDDGGQDRGSRADGTRREVAVRRDAAPRVDAARGGGGQQSGRPSDNQGSNAGQYGNRGSSAGQYGNRGNDARANDSRRPAARSNDDWRVNDRRYDDRRYDNGRNNAVRGLSRLYDALRYGSHGYGRYGSYDRDAWRGRLRFGLGISIFSGRPFNFRFDYGWRPRFNYYYSMQPGMSYGGMSFLLDPDQAEVYIDGEFVGIARDFGGEPVPIAVGFHRIELYAPGFEPVAFDINVRPGQVIPYRGSLYPVY